MATVRIAVPLETFPGERRVALIPGSLAALRKLGAEVLVESGAGHEAGFSDESYTAAGGSIVSDRDRLFAEADVVCQVRAAAANPTAGAADLPRLRNGQILIAQCDPLSSPQTLQQFASQQATVFAMELMPR
ncbi:MAG: hypothetical protein KF861_08075, partial [Planctomycetaceae bacterium]|nr:hypothetical protein [Planctomycetaceae bacterium]